MAVRTPTPLTDAVVEKRSPLAEDRMARTVPGWRAVCVVLPQVEGRGCPGSTELGCPAAPGLCFLSRVAGTGDGLAGEEA